MSDKLFEKILLIGQIKSLEVYLSDFIKELDERELNDNWNAKKRYFKDSLIILNNSCRMINYLEEENDNLIKLCEFTENMKETIYKLENYDRLKRENEQLKKNIN